MVLPTGGVKRPHSSISQPPPTAPGAGAGAAAGGSSAAGGAGGKAPEEEEEEEEDGPAGQYANLHIPDHLKVHLSDSAEDRLRKKKKVKALKLAHRQRINNDLATSAASSWQKFREGKR